MGNRLSQVSKSRILSLVYWRQVLWRPLELLACIQEECLVFGQQHKQFHPCFFLDTEFTFFTVYLKLFCRETLFFNLLYVVGYFSGFLPFLADLEGSSVSQVPYLITIKPSKVQMVVFLSTATLGGFISVAHVIKDPHFDLSWIHSPQDTHLCHNSMLPTEPELGHLRKAIVNTTRQSNTWWQVSPRNIYYLWRNTGKTFQKTRHVQCHSLS